MFSPNFPKLSATSANLFVFTFQVHQSAIDPVIEPSVLVISSNLGAFVISFVLSSSSWWRRDQP